MAPKYVQKNNFFTSVSSDNINHNSVRPTLTEKLCPIALLEGEQIGLACPSGFKRHPKYCSLFYQCTKSSTKQDYQILILSCPKGFIFDNNTMQCIPQSETEQCVDNLISNNLYRKLDENGLFPVSLVLN